MGLDPRGVVNLCNAVLVFLKLSTIYLQKTSKEAAESPWQSSAPRLPASEGYVPFKAIRFIGA
jgi:hypothetical protein